MPSTVISAADGGLVFHFAGFQGDLHRGGVRLVLEHQPAERPREKLQCLGVELAGIDRLQAIAVGELQLIGIDGPQRHQPPRIAGNAEPQRHQFVHGDILAHERPRAPGGDRQPQRLFRGKPAGQADVHPAAVSRQAVFVVTPIVDGPGRNRLDGVDLPVLRHLGLDREAGGGGHAEIGGNPRGRLASAEHQRRAAGELHGRRPPRQVHLHGGVGREVLELGRFAGPRRRQRTGARLPALDGRHLLGDQGSGNRHRGAPFLPEDLRGGSAAACRGGRSPAGPRP